MKKIYDTPQTPYQRVIAHPDISDATKTRLTSLLQTLNPFQLKREITQLQGQLIALSLTLRNTSHKEAL